MKETIKSLARKIIGRIRGSSGTDNTNLYGYQGRFDTWQEASEGITGYASPEIVQKVASASQKVLTGESAYERDSVNFERIEYAFPIMSALLWCAAINDKLNVLDFGGGLGTQYLQTRHILSFVKELKWTIVEQPLFVEYGKEIFKKDNVIKFVNDIDEVADFFSPNIVIASSSLQYFPDPHNIISKIAGTMADVIVIDRTIVSQKDYDEVTRQYVDPKIFSAVIPTWIMSEKKLMASFGGNYKLLARFPATASTQSLDNERLMFDELGFIFVKRGSKFDPDNSTDWTRTQ